MRQSTPSFLAAIVLLSVAAMAQAAHPWADSGKRGVGLSLATEVQVANLQKLAVLDVPWFYSWGAEPNSGFVSLPEQTSFVPMSWGRFGPGSHQATWIAGEQAGLYDTLLGFNEPDIDSQANMTVEEALDLWPLFEATGLRLGSPAAASFNNGWMTDFMTGVQQRGLRVDFLAVHRYAGPDPQGFLNHIDDIHSQYGLPIWVTEFAVRDGDAETPEENRYTDQQVYNFMADVLPGLESRSYVERYAWFPSDRENPDLTSSALFEANGELSKLGRLYNGEEEPPYMSGMFANAGFESSPLTSPVYTSAGADNWTTVNEAATESYYAHTGRQSLSLAPGIDSGQAGPGIARQEFVVGVDVHLNESYSLGAWVFHPSSDPLTGTREATLRIQWFNSSGVLIGDQRTVALNASSPTDEWLFVTLEGVQIPNDPNIAEVRATLWVNNVGPDSVNSGAAYFDNVVFASGVSLPLAGDFNADGMVDAADYAVWRNHLGEPDEAPLNGAGDGQNGVDQTDYELWKANYGADQQSSATASPTPEPDSLVLALLVSVVISPRLFS